MRHLRSKTKSLQKLDDIFGDWSDIDMQKGVRKFLSYFRSKKMANLVLMYLIQEMVRRKKIKMCMYVCNITDLDDWISIDLIPNDDTTGNNRVVFKSKDSLKGDVFYGLELMS